MHPNGLEDSQNKRHQKQRESTIASQIYFHIFSWCAVSFPLTFYFILASPSYIQSMQTSKRAPQVQESHSPAFQIASEA